MYGPRSMPPGKCSRPGGRRGEDLALIRAGSFRPPPGLALDVGAEVLEVLEDVARLEGITAADVAGEVLEEWAKRPRQRRPS